MLKAVTRQFDLKFLEDVIFGEATGTELHFKEEVSATNHTSSWEFVFKFEDKFYRSYFDVLTGEGWELVTIVDRCTQVEPYEYVKRGYNAVCVDDRLATTS